MSQIHRIIGACCAAALALAACGEDSTEGAAAGGAERPTVVVTTSILGDVVGEIAGDQVEVVTIMPVGADPHDFQASAQQANEIREADALVVNGAGFEEGLLDVIGSAEADGVPSYAAIAAVDPIELGDDDHHDHDEHAGEEAHDEHAGEEADDEHAGEEGADPHFFTDPARMAVAVEGIADFLARTVEGIDAAALEQSTAAYVDELRAVDAEIEELLAGIPEDDRVLVTNHEVFGYFADRYGFEVVGAILPSGSTADGVSAGQLAELAEVVEAEGVPAIFADISSSDELAGTLAAEVGDVAVVQLFSESLGEEGSGGETYLAMVRVNAQRIAEALGGPRS